MRNKHGNDGLGKGDAQNLRKAVTRAPSKHSMRKYVCVFAHLWVEAQKGRTKSYMSGPFIHKQSPAASGRGGRCWIRLWKGAGEGAAVQSTPLPLLMRHVCHRKENQSLVPVIKYLHYKGIPSS